MSADEFEVIRTLFAPLASGAGARGLVDDVAVINARGDLVVTTDAIVEGVHFLPDDPVGDIAKKALRVNLSDIAGKGAKPTGALLTLIWPDHRPSGQIAEFARGLGEDLVAYGVALWGGDTASTPGPMTVSITAFGDPIGSRTPSRAGARIGDDVWVSGAFGDAWLGFLARRGEWRPSDPREFEYVTRRYRLPSPRVDCAPLVARFASASMDVSDGLAGDAEKMGRASGVSLSLLAADVPLSKAARSWSDAHGGYGRLLDWGDDYEILFTAPPDLRQAIVEEAASLGVGIARIGAVEAGEGAEVLDQDGRPLPVSGAHSHRLGR